MLATYRVPVLSIDVCGEDVATLRMQRPEGYEFRAGQYLRLTLETAEGPEVRTLSHAAAPGDDWLEVSTRRSDSAFKRALFLLAPGDTVEVSAAAGRFALPEDDRLAVLVGGVGITPLRSTLRDALARGRSFEDVLFLYGNRDESCELYLEELLEMAGRGVRVVRVLERPAEHWVGESGFIGADTVRRHLATDDGRPYVLSGPPVMVEAMGRVLDELGVEEQRRHIEAFGAIAR